MSETYNYHFSDNLDWFGDHDGSVDISPGEKHTLTFNGVSSNSITENHCQLEVTPLHKPPLSKSVSSPLFIGQLDIDQGPSLVPEKISLLPYPNPFNSTINIRISNVKEMAAIIEIHSVSGRLIETIPLNNNVKDQEIKWEATGLPSGVYFIRLVNGYDNQFKKVLYLK